MKDFLLQLMTVLLIFGCEQQAKKKDTVLDPTGPVDSGESRVSSFDWLDSYYFDADGKENTVLATDLADPVGLKKAIRITYDKADLPLNVFRGKEGGSNGAMNSVPFLAFASDEGAKISARYQRSIGGKTDAQVVVSPVSCPAKYLDLAAAQLEAAKIVQTTTKKREIWCIPLLNAVIPDFLASKDATGAYVHKISLSVKTGALDAATASVQFSTEVVIPGANLTLAPSKDLSTLGLFERVTIATNDLSGMPRRDFKAFEISGDVGPGVNTKYIFNFKSAKMYLVEEVFFERPIVKGDSVTKPLISRAAYFYKRMTTIDSLNHFRLRVAYDDGSGTLKYFGLPANGTASLEAPILEGATPLKLYVIPDFGNESANKNYLEYVKPFSPTFCPGEQGAAFKAEEWRQSRSLPYYTACDAYSRQRLVDLADATSECGAPPPVGRIAKCITSPMETFFGSYSYMPFLAGGRVGGSNGVLSLRLTLTGEVKIYAASKTDGSLVQVGYTKLDTTFLLPTAVDEMSARVDSGKSTPGLDTIVTGMKRRGFMEIQNGGVFPFMGEQSSEIFY